MKAQFVGLLLLVLLSTNGLAANAAISISFSSNAITIHGGTPGTTFFLFSVSNEPAGYYNTVARHELLTIADRSGAATVQVDHVAQRSVWFVVDTRTGEYAIASPPGFPLLATLTPPQVLLDKAGVERLAISRDFADIAVVRPGTGAWIDSVSKGGPKDSNKGGGPLHATAGAFHAVDNKAPGPEHLTPADLVIIVDPHTLQHYVGNPVAQK